jgi:glycosyltransferase involved in cell wall biosynthesis
MLSRTKIVHLTSVHSPFDIRIFYKECHTLAEAGCEVVLIAAHEHDEVRDGVRIRAIPRPRGRWERMTRTAWQVCWAALRENGCVYHFHDPELVPAGLLLKAFGKKVVYDVHEDVRRDILSKFWIPSALRSCIARLWGVAETIGARAFDGIVAATPPIGRKFPCAKTVIVQNFPCSEELSHGKTFPYAERPAVVVYIGSITAPRGIGEAIEAMTLLPDSLSARLVLAGRFGPPPELESELRQMPGWKRVEFVSWQSREWILNLLAQARVGLVTFHPAPGYAEAQPNKLFEYM